MSRKRAKKAQKTPEKGAALSVVEGIPGPNPYPTRSAPGLEMQVVVLQDVRHGILTRTPYFGVRGRAEENTIGGGGGCLSARQAAAATTTRNTQRQACPACGLAHKAGVMLPCFLSLKKQQAARQDGFVWFDYPCPLGRRPRLDLLSRRCNITPPYGRRGIQPRTPASGAGGQQYPLCWPGQPFDAGCGNDDNE